MSETPFERRRASRLGQVVVRLSATERRELDLLAQRQKATISDVLRDGLAYMLRLNAAQLANGASKE